MFQMLYLTTFRGYGLGEPEPPPRDRLGPALEVRYFLSIGDGPIQTIAQDLYPFAEGGAVWAFTPSDRAGIWWHGVNLPASGGWWHSVALRGLLKESGLSDAPSRVGGAVAPAIGGGGSIVGPALSAALTAIVLLGAILAAAARRGRSRIAAGCRAR